jgi:tRNA (guanine37-N1)-methyltransferase
MHVKIVTIFPEMFESFLAASLIGRAIESGKLAVELIDLRSFAHDRHRTVDDIPYGGGGGMVMRAEPWIEATRSAASERSWRVLLSPQGPTLDEVKVRELAARPELVLLCGRYEGIDERVRQLVVDEELSIGDYVLSGGEVAAMVVVEALSRQVPGVVGLADSVENDSFRRGLLDYPHYTRPRSVEGLEVPEVLLSGDHAAVADFRRREALRATLEKRPDLLPGAELEGDDRDILQALGEASCQKSAG